MVMEAIDIKKERCRAHCLKQTFDQPQIYFEDPALKHFQFIFDEQEDAKQLA